jgi:gamma-glutamyltranspeptidase/glutathione hydrolase
MRTRCALEGLGHTIKSLEDPYIDVGSGQYIWKLDRNNDERDHVAASDTRRDGLAAGF